MHRKILEFDSAKIVPHAQRMGNYFCWIRFLDFSKASLILGCFSNPILWIKYMKSTITDVLAIAVFSDYYPGVSRSYSKGKNMDIQNDHTVRFLKWCNLKSMLLYQFSSELHQFSWLLFWQKCYWYLSFHFCFLVWKEAHWSV